MTSQRTSVILSRFLLVAVISCFCSGASWAGNTLSLSRGQTVYAPIYSHIYSGDKEQPFYLAATLSIRNVDPNHQITITKVDYYDSAGSLLKKYLEKAVVLDPMASTRYVVKESDKTGGSGANFLVQWKSEKMVNPPIVESVMIGAQRQQGISFTSRGKVIEETE
ncbi:MAG: DUF3124 domain-containing protein [Deltaproteobacteria bacterium]|nr:DUF3124 domain-containing protein [Deltaproteobacteria bacterium]